MSIEQNLETAVSFIQTWREKPGRILTELISLHNETNRKPDRYLLEIINGELIDPLTRRPVKEFIDTTSYLGKIEADIAVELGKRGEKNEGELAVWITPPYPGIYPSSKIIIHRLVFTGEGRKVWDSVAVLFEAEEKEILNLIPDPKIKTLEDLRKKLFVFKNGEEALFKIQSKLETCLTRCSSEEEELFLRAKYFRQMIMSNVSPFLIAKAMGKVGFLGVHAISCGPTFSQLFTPVSITEGKFVVKCGNCGAPINAVISKGYLCPNCGGIYEGC